MLEGPVTEGKGPVPPVVPSKCVLGSETGRLNCERLCSSPSQEKS